jgi:predicted permease
MRLYPRAFRERYGAELEGFFLEARAESGNRALFWARTIRDVVGAALRLRLGSGPGGGVELAEVGRAARTLARAPLFTSFAALTLALGIGATTAVFSVVDTVLLRALPYPDGDRLVAIGARFRHDPDDLGPASPGDVRRLQASPGPLAAVAAVGTGNAVLTGMGDAERIATADVSEAFFDTFDGSAEVGRLFARDELEAGAPDVAVLSHGFWTERFGADPGAVGSTVTLDGREYTVVGVIARSFRTPEALTDERAVWLPLRIDPLDEGRSFYLRLAGRLAPGTSVADAGAHVDRVYRDHYDGETAFIEGARAVPLRDATVGAIGSTLGRVLAAVALLLVIACVNVASLLMTRAAERRDELAVRAALGAGRGRLLRQLLFESLALAGLGALGGAALARAAIAALRASAPGGIPRLAEVAVDARVLAFAVAVASVTVLAFGLLPALRASRTATRAAVATGRGMSQGRREARIRSGLVLVETALATTLVVGTGLMAHDLIRLVREDPGFDSAGMVGLRLVLDEERVPEEQWPTFWDRLLAEAGSLPGVSAAALTSERPYTGEGIVTTVTPERPDGEAEAVWVSTHIVTPEYLEALRVPVIEGRHLGVMDADGEPAAVVSEAFVRRYWPDGRALGRTVREGEPDEEGASVYRIVGVVGDLRQRPGFPPPPSIYVPLGTRPWRAMALVVRTEPEATAAAATALRDLVRRIDPSLPPGTVGTLAELARERLARPRFYTALLGSFGVLSLSLALVGIYATTAYATRARTREIGIRMALGAKATRVVGEVVRRTGTAVVAGAALGLVASWLAARALADVLRYVEPRDPGTLVVVAALVLAAGTVAAWLPAARAARVDPARTLREDG